METKKVTNEVDSPENGILGKILVQENNTVPVGSIVAYLLKPGESISDLEALIVQVEREEISAEPSITLEYAPPAQAEIAGKDRILASPLARRIARSCNIDLRTVKGTGPDRMIIREDIEKAFERKRKESVPISAMVQAGLAEKTVGFTGMRRAIAKKMLSSKVETAQTYMSNTVDASKIVEYRKTLLPEIQETFGVRLTITDIMMKIAGAAIKEHPIMNTRWTDEGILYLEDVHMGMAMALDEGLIVPVIRDINKKSLAQIAKDRIELIRKGKTNDFLPDDITGSTFTLSAMGMFGIEHFTANINVPENAILAVGAIIDKPVVIDGEMVIMPMMNVTLSYDHRTIDGAEAGKFMRTLKSFIESLTPLQKAKVTVIGGGVGGYPAAIKAARMGSEVTLIEKDLLGGVCLNWGCVPTKSLLQSGRMIKTVKGSGIFGVNCGNYMVDFSKIMERKNSVVQQLRNSAEKLLVAKKVRIIKGTAKLLNSSTVQILETGEKIHSDKIIIASGFKPATLNVEGAEGPYLWNSDDFLTMENLPKSVVIIGGGVIGVEFAQILNGLGVDVKILEMMETLIPGMDKEIVRDLEKSIVDEGIRVFTKAQVKKITNEKNTVRFTNKNGTKEFETEKVIVSVARKPDLTWLNLDKIGLATKNGALLVNEHLETNIPGIYAVGDVVGGSMLAHVAIAEGECAAKKCNWRKNGDEL